MAVVGSTLQGRAEAREALYRRYRSKIVPNGELDRSLVSFQANRKRSFYRWLKYKEAFSAKFVKYIIKRFTKEGGVLLDPFAGVGTALFEARGLGWDAIGIELLPVGFFLMDARLAAERVGREAFRRSLARIEGMDWKACIKGGYRFEHIPITEGAFPIETQRELEGFCAYIRGLRDANLRKVFELAGLAVLEEISYTRKDGQYLRWDHRAGKPRVKSSFNKGQLVPFGTAIKKKLREIYSDLFENGVSGLFDGSREKVEPGNLDLRKGSCLEILPGMRDESVDLVVTSPPYCNRYDYTRTYALELVYLGLDAEDVKKLRQTMLSCTVENHPKLRELEELYRRIGRNETMGKVLKVVEGQASLREVLDILDELGSLGRLNNSNIPKMVKNYFLEMGFVTYELARLLRRGGKVVMVNDNVRYAGEEVPVDLILSDFARRFGLLTKNIWVLPRGKGNSSQQMGCHGRHELRKCVYVWEKA
jgi:Tfp pilus assembly protein PilZ